MAIYFFNEGISFTLPHKGLVTRWISEVITNEGKALEEITYIFCHDDYLYDISKKHLGHETRTDVITFDYAETPAKLYADIYISLPCVEANAWQEEVNFFEELARVMVHGVLHLLGYQDRTLEEKKNMQAKEEACLAMQEIAPYLATPLSWAMQPFASDMLPPAY